MGSFTGIAAIVMGIAMSAPSWAQTAKKDLPNTKNSQPEKMAIASPLDKLDPEKLTPIERDQLPPDTVAVISGDAGSILSCAFSIDGKFATATDKGAIVLWDLTGAVPKEITTIKLENAIGSMERVVFSPDGKQLAGVQGANLYLWNVTADGATPFDMKPVGRIEGLAFHPNGKMLICGSNVGLPFAITDKRLTPLPGKLPGANRSFQFSPDGTVFGSVFFTPQRNGSLYGSEVMLWKIMGNKASDLAMIREDTTIKTIAFSPDGKLLATAGLDKQVRLYDLTGKKIELKTKYSAPKWIRDVYFTADGAGLVGFSSGADIVLWNVASGEKEKSWEFVPRMNSSFATGAMYLLFSASAMAPDGKHVAFSNHTAKAVIIRIPPPSKIDLKQPAVEVAKGAPSPLDKLDRDQLSPIEQQQLPPSAVAVIPGNSGSILSCAFSVDGKFATGTDKGALVLWDLTGTVPKEITSLKMAEKTGSMDRVAFSPDGKQLAGVQAGTLYLWNVTAKGAQPVDSKPVGRVEGFAFHPSGKLLICGANVGQMFVITDKQIFPLTDKLQGANSSYRFSSDGTIFGSVFFSPQRNGNLYGSEVMFWKIAENKAAEYSMIQEDASIKAIAFSPDSKLVATSSLDTQVRLYDFTAKKPVVKAKLSAPKWIRNLFFTADGTFLVGFSSGADIVMWNVATGEKERAWEFVPRVNSSFATGAMYRLFSASALSPDGRHAAFSNNNEKAVILRLLVKGEGKKDGKVNP